MFHSYTNLAALEPPSYIAVKKHAQSDALVIVTAGKLTYQALGLAHCRLDQR